MSDKTYEYWHDDPQIERVFMGRRITGAEGDVLTLDNGTKVTVVPNQGGCSCASGDYELTKIAAFDNVITKVEQVVTHDSIEDYQEQKKYELFVYAGEEKIAALEVDGDDGNGYYGTGYSLLVTPGEPS